MAPACGAIGCLLVALSLQLSAVSGQGRGCDIIPASWKVDWYSYESSAHTDIMFEQDNTYRHSRLYDSESGAQCHSATVAKDPSLTNGFYYLDVIVRYATESGRICYGCIKFEQRSQSVIEYIIGTCAIVDPATLDCNFQVEMNIMFKTQPDVISCRSFLQGVWMVSYEYQDNRGLCSSPRNYIEACQRPGSPYQDNHIYYQKYSICPGVTRSTDELKEYQCMGTWQSTDPSHVNYEYTAIMDRGAQDRLARFRCLLRDTASQLENNRIRYTKSDTPECSKLKSDFDGPERNVIEPMLSSTQLVTIQPECMFPEDFQGKWFTSSEYDSRVEINATHIYFYTIYSEFLYLETYYTCQESRDTRFMVKQVTKGRCEIDLICFEFIPRHQNIIRFRMGKPFRDGSEITTQRPFPLVCSWNAFTMNREENRNYVYQTFIMDPPAPVNCPIGGIYQFQQHGFEQFKYYTRIRGVTERPRVKIYCNLHESEIKVCNRNPRSMWLDVDRCAALDMVGRPVGDYDEPDNYLECVGFWYENQKSYLVTYDTEDRVSMFRCWVYERHDFRYVRMSRGLRSACHPLQLPNSSSYEEGASLALVLTENEREFDDCPQNFFLGNFTYEKLRNVYVLGTGGSEGMLHRSAARLCALFPFAAFVHTVVRLLMDG